MDRGKNWTTQLRQLLMQSSKYCAAKVQLLSDQSYTPVSLDLFDVFQWRAGGGHCLRLEPLSTPDCRVLAHSLWSLTLYRLYWEPGHHVVIRLLLITLVDDQSNVSCQLQMRWQLISVSVFGVSVLLSFWTFSLPFRFRFLPTFSFPLTESV